MAIDRLVHNVRLSVFCKEHEDPVRIADAFIALVPFDLDEEKVEIKKTRAQGFGEKTIVIFEIVLDKQRHIRQFVDHLKSVLSEDQRNRILSQKESRLDEDLNFFIRIDKRLWLEAKKAQLTDTGDCFHIRMTVAAFPAKRENALEVVDSIFRD